MKFTRIKPGHYTSSPGDRKAGYHIGNYSGQGWTLYAPADPRTSGRDMVGVFGTLKAAKVAAEVHADAAAALDSATEPKVEAEKHAATDYTHGFVDASGYCVRYVEHPDGRMRQCGEPVKSAIHDPAAYLAYEREVTQALAEWSGRPSTFRLSPRPASAVDHSEYAHAPDAEIVQLLALLDYGVTITRELYRNWTVERSARLAFPIDQVKLDRAARAAVFYGLAVQVDALDLDHEDTRYTLKAEPIHLARTDSETWCGRRIFRAGVNRLRFTDQSVPGPKHQRCVERSADPGKRNR